MSDGRWLAGTIDEFPPRAWRVARVGKRAIGIYNTGERLHAVLNVCPHEGAPLCVRPLGGTMLPAAPERLEYGLEDRVLRCPWHGWEFDVETGEMLFGTGSRRLTTFPVTVEGDRVFIDVERRTA